MTERMCLQRRGDHELHLLGDAPRTTTIARQLLAAHDPRWMRVDGDSITFTLTNGTWRYRITDHSLETVVIVALIEDRGEA